MVFLRSSLRSRKSQLERTRAEPAAPTSGGLLSAEPGAQKHGQVVCHPGRRWDLQDSSRSPALVRKVSVCFQLLRRGPANSKRQQLQEQVQIRPPGKTLLGQPHEPLCLCQTDLMIQKPFRHRDASETCLEDRYQCLLAARLIAWLQGWK